MLNSNIDEKKLKFLYSLKLKYFDSDLSENVKKIVQRVYDDFGVMIFPVDNKDVAMKIYEALEEAHKIAASVGDKTGNLKIIDTTSIYRRDKYGALFSTDFVGINPNSLKDINNLLRHEISGHVSHHVNSKEYYDNYSCEKQNVKKYLEAKKIDVDFDIIKNLFMQSKENPKNTDYIIDKIFYMIKSPLKFVAVIKQFSSSLPFDEVKGSL